MYCIHCGAADEPGPYCRKCGGRSEEAPSPPTPARATADGIPVAPPGPALKRDAGPDWFVVGIVVAGLIALVTIISSVARDLA